MNRRWWLSILAVYAFVFFLQLRCAPNGRAGLTTHPVRPAESEALADTGPRKDDVSVEKLIPATPEPWQKRPPCDDGQDERPINGACWQATSRRPPCGPLWRSGDLCLRPIAKPKPQPVSGE